MDVCIFQDPDCIVDPKIDCSRQDQIYIVKCNRSKDNVEQEEIGERRIRKNYPGVKDVPIM